MAIYHLSTKPISRSSGRTATASIAYRAGIAIQDERTGKSHDYTKRSGVVATQLHTPNNLKIERNELWNLAEKTETRKNSRTAREIVVNLPHELSERDRSELVNDFAQDLADKYGVAVDVAIHTPDKEGDNRNHHAHLMLTTRKLERLESGRIALTSKSQLEMSNTQLKERGLRSAKEELKVIREQWANIANERLEEAGIDARIDHRSHKDRGLDQLPTVKIGWEATALERKGIRTAKGEQNRAIKAYNTTLDQIKNIGEEIEQEQSNEQLRKAVDRATKAVRATARNTGIAVKNANFTNEVFSDAQRSIANTERAVERAERVIEQADRAIAEHQRQLEQPVPAEAVTTELSVDEARKVVARYNQLKTEVEQAFEKASTKSLHKELAQLKQAYDTAKKPFWMSQSKWTKQQLDERTKIRQLERQIRVKEYNNKGKFEQKAKDWIATNKPDEQKGYEEAQQIMREHNKIQREAQQQQQQERVRTSSRDSSRDRGR